jgi:hypothetical protein
MDTILHLNRAVSRPLRNAQSSTKRRGYEF